MPTRTMVQELCDVCYADDETESDATDRLRFAWQGRDYTLLVCENHVSEIRDQLQHLSEIATTEGGRRRGGQAGARSGQSVPQPAATRAVAERQTPVQVGKTLFSQLSDEEKSRFRLWADMPNARRIGDSRVEEWTAAGRP